MNKKISPNLKKQTRQYTAGAASSGAFDSLLEPVQLTVVIFFKVSLCRH
jgi:hypothetical protein